MRLSTWFKTAALAGALGMSLGTAQAQEKLLLSTFFPPMHPLYADVLQPWAKAIQDETEGRVVEAWRPWCRQLDGQALDCGHFLPDEAPTETAAKLLAFFS